MKRTDAPRSLVLSVLLLVSPPSSLFFFNNNNNNNNNPSSPSTSLKSHGSGLSLVSGFSVGDITGFECYNVPSSTSWYAWEPSDLSESNATVDDCVQKCWSDGFEYAGMRTVTPNATVPDVQCECGCDVLDLTETEDVGACTQPCSATPNSEFPNSCPSSTEYLSVYTIQVEDPFCEINRICDEALYDDIRTLCQEETGLYYGIALAILAVLVIIAGIFIFYKRHAICRSNGAGSRRRKPTSASAKRQILEDQLINSVNADSLVQSVQQPWVIDVHKITMGKMIAAGSSGQVYAGDFEGKPVAVKELFSVLFDPESLKDFKDEASMLASLHHPHIVRFFGIATRSTERGPAYYLITELKEQSLRAYMNNCEQPDRLVILRMAAEIVSAIDFLHSRSVVHRDLKPENVLLDQFLSVFLCDFGIAKQMDESNRMVDMTSDMGTAAYMAPELASSKLLDDIEDTDLVIAGSYTQSGVAGHSHNRPVTVSTDGVELGDMQAPLTGGARSPSAASLIKAKEKGGHFRKIGKKVVVSMHEGSKVDIFAFGMLLYSMCAWKPPFSGHRPLQILAFITLQHRRPALAGLTQFPEQVHDLIRAAWAHNPKDRPSCDELKSILSQVRAELVNGEGPKLLH